MRKIFYTICLLASFSLQAMEASKKVALPSFQSPKKATPYFTNQENDGGFKIALQSLEKTGPGDEIIVDQFIMTDDRLPTMLIKKHTQGVKISVNVCGGSSWSNKTIESLKAAGIDVFVFNDKTKKTPNPFNNFPLKLHKKSIIWTYLNQSSKKIFRAWDGGRNLSYMASAAHKDKETNQEAMIYHSGDDAQTIFESQKDSHLKLRKTKRDTWAGAQVLKGTPEKMRKLQSHEFDICSSIAKRIENIASGDLLYMSIFAINHPKIMNACRNAAKTGSFKLLITDHYTLKKDESVVFLKELQKMGVDVRIFNHDGSKKCANRSIINHEKMFVRQKADGSMLTGIGSTNFTSSNNADITDFNLNNDQDFGYKCIKHINDLKDQSSPLEDVLKK